MERKRPTKNTVKRLFALSGNRCAYPGCKQRLFDEKGNYFKNICHIQAESKNGPRYNKKLTVDERRSFQNLIILCTKHHGFVDNNSSFTAAKLKKMKKAHEAKFEKKPYEISENVLNRLIKSVNNQYELLYDDIKTIKNGVKKINDILTKANPEKKSSKNLGEHIFTGEGFTISWPASWTTNVPYISHKELSDRYFEKNTDLKFSNPEPVIQIRSKKQYFGIYPAALASVTLVPKISLETFVEFVKNRLEKLSYDILESHVDKLNDSATIITSIRHGKTTSYFSQKLQIHNGRLYGFIISNLTEQQLRKYPKLVKELKQIAHSFRFAD